MDIDEKIKELEIKKRNAFEMAKISLENNETENVEKYVSFYKQLSDEYHNLEMEKIGELKQNEHR